MKRDFNLKPRESKELPLKKLRDILCKVYPEEVVDELMDRLADKHHLTEEDNDG